MRRVANIIVLALIATQLMTVAASGTTIFYGEDTATILTGDQKITLSSYPTQRTLSGWTEAEIYNATGGDYNCTIDTAGYSAGFYQNETGYHLSSKIATGGISLYLDSFKLYDTASASGQHVKNSKTPIVSFNNSLKMVRYLDCYDGSLDVNVTFYPTTYTIYKDIEIGYFNATQAFNVYGGGMDIDTTYLEIVFSVSGTASISIDGENYANASTVTSGGLSIELDDYTYVTIPSGRAFDSLLGMTPTKYRIFDQPDNTTLISVMAPYSFFNKSAEYYPITIDPVVSQQTTPESITYTSNFHNSGLPDNDMWMAGNAGEALAYLNRTNGTWEDKTGIDGFSPVLFDGFIYYASTTNNKTNYTYWMGIESPSSSPYTYRLLYINKTTNALDDYWDFSISGVEGVPRLEIRPQGDYILCGLMGSSPNANRLMKLDPATKTHTIAGLSTTRFVAGIKWHPSGDHAYVAHTYTALSRYYNGSVTMEDENLFDGSGIDLQSYCANMAWFWNTTYPYFIIGSQFTGRLYWVNGSDTSDNLLIADHTSPSAWWRIEFADDGNGKELAILVDSDDREIYEWNGTALNLIGDVPVTMASPNGDWDYAGYTHYLVGYNDQYLTVAYANTPEISIDAFNSTIHNSTFNFTGTALREPTAESGLWASPLPILGLFYNITNETGFYTGWAELGHGDIDESVSCWADVDLSILPEGHYNITFKAHNAVYTSEYATEHFLLDLPPIIDILSHIEGQGVSGNITLSGTVSRAGGGALIWFKVGSGSYRTATLNTTDWTWDTYWDTTEHGDGTYTLVFKVVDGTQTTLKFLNLTVDNVPEIQPASGGGDGGGGGAAPAESDGAIYLICGGMFILMFIVIAFLLVVRKVLK